jgi:hypothetical protein
MDEPHHQDYRRTDGQRQGDAVLGIGDEVPRAEGVLGSMTGMGEGRSGCREKEKGSDFFHGKRVYELRVT